MDLVKVDNEAVTEDDVLNNLRFTDEIDDIVDRVVNRRVVVAGARALGLSVADEELQEAADTYRAFADLSLAKDTTDWLDGMHTDAEAWEKFLEEELLIKKVSETIASEDKVASYFRTKQHEYERVEIAQIATDSEDVAKEVLASAGEGADFADIAKSVSMDEETKNGGGYVGLVSRDQLPEEMEAKVFNSCKGAVLGPFDDEGLIYVIKVLSDKRAELTEALKRQIGRTLMEEWTTDQSDAMDVEWI